MLHNTTLEAFAGALNDQAQKTIILPLITSNHGSVEERLSVYQNNVQLTQIDALAETFNSVAALVGEDFFSAMAKEFTRHYKPTSMNLNDYGNEFPDFISAFSHAQPLPYLADMARFDLAWHQSFFAENEHPITAEQLNNLTDLPAEELRLTFAAHVKLLNLEYPAHALWEYCMLNGKGIEASPPELTKKHYPIIIWREGLKVNYSLEPSISHHGYTQIKHGETLEAIANSLLKEDADFNISEWLTTLFSRNLLI